MPAWYNFISNNVKGLKLTLKSTKLFEYCSQWCSFCSRNSFNQGNQTKMERWIEWVNIFFSHGKSNSCRVFIAVFVSKSVTTTKEISGNNGAY